MPLLTHYWPLWLLAAFFAFSALRAGQRRFDLSIRERNYLLSYRPVLWFFSALFAGLALMDWVFHSLLFQPFTSLNRVLWGMLALGALAICSGLWVRPPEVDHGSHDRLSASMRARRWYASLTSIGALLFNVALAVWLVATALTLYRGML